MSSPRIFYLVPNITDNHRSRDYLFRKHCYSAYQAGRQPNDLRFDGYFRAICIYSGEESLNKTLKSGKKVYQTLLQYPDLARRLRDLAITKGYLRPQENTFPTTIFWNQATFSQTTDEGEARKIFRLNPQPPVARHNIPFAEDWPKCPDRWIPAPVPKDSQSSPRDFTAEDSDAQDSDSEASESTDSDGESSIMPSGSQPRSSTGQFAPASSGRKSKNPSTPASRTPRTTSTVNTTLERELTDQIYHNLKYVKVSHNLTTRHVRGKLDAEKFSEAMTTTFIKFPDAYKLLKEALDAALPDVAISGSEIALRLINEAETETRGSTAKKHTAIDISDDEKPDETPTKRARRILFKDEIAARAASANARASSSAAKTPTNTGIIFAASQSKIDRLTIDRTYYKYLSEKMHSILPEVGPFEVINWGSGLHAFIYENEGFIDVPRVVAVIRAIIAVVTGIFAKSDSTARKGLATVHENQLIDAIKSRSADDVCLTAGAAYMYAQEHSYAQLFALGKDGLVEYINNQNITLAHIGAILDVANIDGFDDAAEAVQTVNLCLD
ncbi:hypothetical protein CLIM01_11584 [Colletotrichum limetticola]|uniref:RNase III domain-containing protein n=1 Tax=Colletotrichum limetticola TaxID=1209924 RepID=A0ABQ9PLK3_9PEZI|nr:hypothetical protein CLIM01_11584 [Colletotrichum limetticola]